MSELIDRQALKDAVKRYAGEPIKQNDRKCQAICLDMLGTIDAQPTIDAVPVVRCKDCKWYSIYEAKKDGTPDKRYSPSVCLRGIYAKRRDPDWYCAEGERREG